MPPAWRDHALDGRLSLPPRGYCPKPASADIWQFRATSSLVRAAYRAVGILDDTERERAQALDTQQAHDTSLVAHVALRMILGSSLGTAPSAVGLDRAPCPLCQGPHGRPVVRRSERLHFSLAYVQNVSLIALCRSPVGIDIESADRLQPQALLQRLHPAEVTALMARPYRQRKDAMLRCWTRKQAYVKGLGTGLAMPMSHVYVGLGFPSGGLDDLTARNGWALTSLTAPHGYAIGIALLPPPATRGRPTARIHTLRQSTEVTRTLQLASPAAG